MARFKVGKSYSADMTDFNFSVALLGEPDVAKKKLYILDFGGGDKIEFHGSDFKYNKKDEPVGGEVHSITLIDGGKTAIDVSEFKISVKSLVEAAETNSTKDDLKLLSKIMSKNDTVSGHDLEDTLTGYGGGDTIYGAGGADLLRGGAAGDRFVYRSAGDSTVAARDSILDFSQSDGDRINLAAVGEFTFVGNTGTFSGNGPEVGYRIVGGDTIVDADVDGDGDVDLSILIEGEFDLLATDFIL